MTTEKRNPNVETKRVRVLVVAPSLDILGGQAVQAERLVTRLRGLPMFEVGFLAINPRLPGAFRRLQSVKYLRTLVTSILYIVNLLRRVRNYDVVHIFSASYLSFVIAPTPAIIIARLFRKQVLLNYHSGEAEDHLRRWRTVRPTLRLADRVVVPSAYLVKVFAKFGIQASAINNLIDLEKFTFTERQPLLPVFLSNRNLEKHYGVDHVLHAFAEIQKHIPDAELTVAGDGPERPALEALAQCLGLNNATFVGRIEHAEIAEQYQRAHICLNGSEIDNQPLSILEAFACGVPLVTTDAGGIPDMVKDGETGFVVRRGDHQAMALRAMQLLRDPASAAAMVGRARNECRNYSWELLAEQWTKLYLEMAAQKGRSRIRRVFAMSAAEMRVRAFQAAAIFAERKGWSTLTKLPSDKKLSALFSQSKSPVDCLEHFRTRGEPSFFEAFDKPEVLIAELRRRWPRAEDAIVSEAERIVAGRFDLLGLKNLSFGEPINWHEEPIVGKCAPVVHWSCVDYLNPEVCGDKKIIWELNRHQHFLKLGQAYWLTKDEKYAQTFVAQLNSWMDQNPPKVGINWASSLEVAFRSISWLWAFHYFKHSPALDSATFARALKFLYLNARHLETYLSTYFSPNTHLTGEALGLVYLGTVFPEFNAASRWRARGEKILVEQLQRQVRADGVYFEQSSYYHRYTSDFYTHLLILSRTNKRRLSGLVEEKLMALVNHLMYITRPDGTSPLLGDDDGGRLLMVDRRPANDFRATLSTAAVLFGRGDYKFVARNFAEETLWLLGPDAARTFDEIKSEEPASQSKDFPDGGYYVMRDGWHDKANYLLFDCGPHGANNCGHAHADALSIEVAAIGRPMLIDPGSHTYTGSQESRDLFRGSSAHNVLMIDGQSSSIPGGPFSWKSIATCKPLSWISERRFDFVAGKHDGYELLPDPATHTRSILFLKNDYWVIRDQVSSDGDHNLELGFHFPPKTIPQISDVKSQVTNMPEPHGKICELASADHARLQIAAFAPSPAGEGRWTREEGWFSACYGSRELAPVCTFSTSFSGENEESHDVVTLLLPDADATSSKFEVKEVEAIGGRAFEITSGNHRDLILLRHALSSRVESVRLASDFNLSWARFATSGAGELLELLVMDGHRIELDGKEMLTSANTIEYLVASRIGDRFRIETSEGLMHLSFPIGNLEQQLADKRTCVELTA